MMIRRLVAAMLVFMMVVSAVGPVTLSAVSAETEDAPQGEALLTVEEAQAPEQAEEQPEPAAQEPEQQEQGPEQSPDAAAEPDASEGSEEPEEAEKPAATEEPDASEGSEEPEEAEKPAATAEPDASEGSEEPEEAEKPAATEEPDEDADEGADEDAGEEADEPDPAPKALSLGSSGEAVRSLQQKLAELGYLDAELVSGLFGDETEAAVALFQYDQGLKVDGIVGRMTLGALNGSPSAYAGEPVRKGEKAADYFSYLARPESGPKKDDPAPETEEPADEGEAPEGEELTGEEEAPEGEEPADEGEAPEGEELTGEEEAPEGDELEDESETEEEAEARLLPMAVAAFTGVDVRLTGTPEFDEEGSRLPVDVALSFTWAARQDMIPGDYAVVYFPEDLQIVSASGTLDDEAGVWTLDAESRALTLTFAEAGAAEGARGSVTVAARLEGRAPQPEAKEQEVPMLFALGRMSLAAKEEEKTEEEVVFSFVTEAGQRLTASLLLPSEEPSGDGLDEQLMEIMPFDGEGTVYQLVDSKVVSPE